MIQNKALRRTLAFEGIFSIDPNDPGGMTYCGISRVMHPDWVAWPEIDAHLATGAPITQPIAKLEPLVELFYATEFTSKLDLTGLEDEKQWYVFDTAVNMGIKFANSLIPLPLPEARLTRIARYVELTDKNKSLTVYLRGWIKRALARLED